MKSILEWKKRVKGGENPKNIKVEFAKEIVARFHNQSFANSAEKNFNTRSQGKIPDDITEIKIKFTKEITIPQLLKQIKFVASTSEAMRLIRGGGVKIDGEKIDNIQNLITNPSSFIIQVGKRKFAHIKFY